MLNRNKNLSVIKSLTNDEKRTLDLSYLTKDIDYIVHVSRREPVPVYSFTNGKEFPIMPTRRIIINRANLVELGDYHSIYFYDYVLYDARVIIVHGKIVISYKDVTLL